MTTTPAPTSCAVRRDAPRFSVAGGFLEALANQDFDGIAATIASDAELQALVPSGLKRFEGPGQIAAAFARWFGDTIQYRLIEAVVGDVGKVLHLQWRVRMRASRLGDGWFSVEQQVYADTDGDGRIVRLRLVCSGYCPEHD